MEFITREEMQQIEQRSTFTRWELMQHAAKGIASYIQSSGCGKTVFVCGPGNNGGDGYSAALLLPEAKVIVAKEPGTEEAKKAHSLLPKERFVEGIEGFDCIVDCLLGTGATGRVREPIRGWIEKMNASGAKIISVDVPSGLGTESEVSAHMTICLHSPKVGMDGKPFVIKDIGL